MSALGKASLVLGCVSLVGCAETFGGPAEYAEYRKTHVAPTLEERLAAQDSYLSHYPEGVYTVEVRASFQAAERVFFRVKSGSIAGLEDYLRALPAGPHGVLASHKLAGLRATANKGDELAALGLSMEARLARARAERVRARSEIVEWIARFLDADVWQRPLAQAKPTLIVPWSLAMPAPVCKSIDGKPGRTCAKLVELPYTIVLRGKAETREATIEIDVTEDADGVPLEARIGGPDLFLRLEETFAVKPIEPGDGEGRIGAIARSAEVVEHAFQKNVSEEPACKHPVVAPVVLDLSCKGVHVELVAAVADGEDDVVRITPERSHDAARTGAEAPVTQEKHR